MADKSGGGPLPRPASGSALEPFKIHVLSDGTNHLILDDTVEFAIEDAQAAVSRFGVVPVTESSRSVLYVHGGEFTGREQLTVKGEIYNPLDLALSIWGFHGPRTDVGFNAVVLNFPESYGIIKRFADDADVVAGRTIAVFGLQATDGEEAIVFSENGKAGTIGKSALGKIGKEVTSRTPKLDLPTISESLDLVTAKPGRQITRG